MRGLFTPVSKNDGADNRYTKKIEVPQYAPSADKPPIEGLIDYTKYSKLLANINKSAVTEEEKKFLKLAATRHIVFRYSLIADYYAHATPEMQELMEQSALVILDIDDAIANGYVKLSKDIRAILEQTGEVAGE
jgi:hypothetical protein